MRGITIAVFFAWALLLPELMQGQQKELRFKHFTKEHGLSSSNVTCVAQTSDGYLWIGTTDGLNRFDGYNFIVYRNDPHDSTSLSDNNITTLFVDSHDDLWIGTQTNGLCRYVRDRNHFRQYLSKPHILSSLSSNYVKSIAEDGDHQLWIATTMGLNRFDRDQNSFDRYFYEFDVVVKQTTLPALSTHGAPDDVVNALRACVGKVFKLSALEKSLAQSLSSEHVAQYLSTILEHSILKITADHINLIKPDEKGNLWLAYERKGLGVFNPRSNVLKLYSETTTDGFWNKEIKSLAVDRDLLWMGTRDGSLATLALRTGDLVKFELPFQAYNIESILRDSKGNVWFGDDYGLCRVINGGERFYRYQNEENNKYSLPTTAVKIVVEDLNHNLWVGCTQGGISLTYSDLKFDHLKHDPQDAQSMTKNSVSAVLKDSKGNIWLGYYTMGVDRIGKDNSITRFAYDPSQNTSIGKGTVFKIFEDSKGVIWFGTYEGGLQYYDPSRNIFVSYRHRGIEKHSIGGNDVRGIAEDSNGNLWIALHGQGIDKFDRNTKMFTHYRADYDNWQHSLANDWVFTVLVDQHDDIWVGSVNGLSVLHHDAENFVTYNRDNSNLSHSNVRTLHEDSGGRIWVGTENGLNRFDRKTKQFVLVNDKVGMPSNTIQSIESDRDVLWISTNNGLTRLDMQTNQFINYAALDGLQSNEFFPNASSRGIDGLLYFGGCNGLNIFDPTRLLADTARVPLRLNALSLFNKPVPVGEKMLPSPLDEASAITFNSNENVFTLSYTGIDFWHAEKLQYAYRLDGFETDWNYVGGKRDATYTNLDPGTYTFRVKVANGDGIWNETARSIQVIILPPFWKTPLAYGLYIVAILILLYAYRRATIYREQLKNQLKLQELQAKQVHEMDLMKLKFFTNISHEFRTPLTLIIGPTQTLQQADDEAMPASRRASYYDLIHRNAQRLLRLINQILDLSALDAGFMKLKVCKNDIVGFCQRITETFQYKAGEMKVEFSFTSNVTNAEVYFDQDVVDKVLYNLLSNAFLYTPIGGRIAVALTVPLSNEVLAISGAGNSGRMLKIQVIDNGPGIAKNLQAKVFERYYRVDQEQTPQVGSGIGLALVKQLVDRHHGVVEVQSEEGKGCIFTVWLPVSKHDFSTEDLSSDPLHHPISNDTTLKPVAPTVNNLDLDVLALPTVLIVEDSEDVRQYLRLNLDSEYTVYEASNGEEGCELAGDINPDVIISDVIMRKRSGFELCSILKGDRRTSHIPIVLLTARSSELYELEGLNHGADDYISKPFSMAVLKARLRNLIDSRQKLKDKFYSDLNFEPANIASNEIDKNFVAQLIAVIERHMSDEQFNPDLLAEEVHVSRSQLYKKVKGLTGLSVSIFVRNIRLRHAANLLVTTGLTISEVAYQVGFSDPGYFTKCFREMYSKTPSEYLQAESRKQKA